VEINADAPAVARAEIDVNAPRELVWEVLTDLASWPRWSPDVESVELDGPVAPGTTFRWKAGRRTVKSTLGAVEPPQLLAWTRRTRGIKAVHVWRLETRGDATVARSAESWEGIAVRLLRERLQKTLTDAVEGGLSHLRDEAERRAAAS